LDPVPLCNDGNVINNAEKAKKFIENYYRCLYQIRDPTDEFLDFDLLVKEETKNIPHSNQREKITEEEVNT